MSGEQGANKLKRGGKKIIRECGIISLIILFVLIFRSSVYEPFRIPTGSMIPTLMIGDFILVNKFSYGLKLPFSDIFLFGHNGTPCYVSGKSNPRRGDIIVFKYPKDYSINYVKRVIGLPGDTIEIKNKVIYVNERPIQTEEIDGTELMKNMDDKFKMYNLKFYKSYMQDHTHIIQQDDDNYFQVDFDKIEIPADHYFVVGDNRDFSYDSRFWGLVPRNLIKGKAVLIWFSMILPFGENNFKFRGTRIFNPIK